LRSSFPSRPGVPHAVPNRSMISRRRVAKNHLPLVLQLTRLPAKLCRHDHSSCLSLVVICSSSMGVVETFPIWPSTSEGLEEKQLKPSCLGVAVLEGLLGIARATSSGFLRGLQSAFPKWIGGCKPHLGLCLSREALCGPRSCLPPHTWQNAPPMDPWDQRPSTDAELSQAKDFHAREAPKAPRGSGLNRYHRSSPLRRRVEA
jgi:hypothetical protein